MSDLPVKSKSKRGFASMDPEKARQIQSMGGKAQLPESRHFAQDKLGAAAAGAKGREAQKKP